jgi:hypothetical protein
MGERSYSGIVVSQMPVLIRADPCESVAKPLLFSLGSKVLKARRDAISQKFPLVMPCILVVRKNTA